MYDAIMEQWFRDLRKGTREPPANAPAPEQQHRLCVPPATNAEPSAAVVAAEAAAAKATAAAATATRTTERLQRELKNAESRVSEADAARVQVEIELRRVKAQLQKEKKNSAALREEVKTMQQELANAQQQQQQQQEQEMEQIKENEGVMPSPAETVVAVPATTQASTAAPATMPLTANNLSIHDRRTSTGGATGGASLDGGSAATTGLRFSIGSDSSAPTIRAGVHKARGMSIASDITVVHEGEEVLSLIHI